jgi:hypothetical protein
MAVGLRMIKMQPARTALQRLQPAFLWLLLPRNGTFKRRSGESGGERRQNHRSTGTGVLPGANLPPQRLHGADEVVGIFQLQADLPD